MARHKHHSCAHKSKKTGKKHHWYHGKCRTRKQRTAYKRAHRR